jgi:hypothetical protein
MSGAPVVKAGIPAKPDASSSITLGHSWLWALSRGSARRLPA